jgi:hypothetical protein
MNNSSGLLPTFKQSDTCNQYLLAMTHHDCDWESESQRYQREAERRGLVDILNSPSRGVGNGLSGASQLTVCYIAHLIRCI